MALRGGGMDGAYVVGYFNAGIVVRNFDALVYALVWSSGT